MIVLTRLQVAALNPCSESKYTHLFKDGESINSRQCLEAGVSLSDLLWVAGRLGLGNECALFADGCSKQAAKYAEAAWLAAESAKYIADAAADAADGAARAAAVNAAATAAYVAYAAAATADAAATAQCIAEQKELFIKIFDEAELKS